MYHSEKQLSVYVTNRLKEYIVNDRPLTYIDEDSFIKPISPNDFLIHNSNKNLLEMKNSYDMDNDDPDVTRKKILKNWKNGRRLLSKMWKIWKHEYLLSLRERHAEKHSNKHCVERIPKIGDVVIVEENSPKKEWRLAIIEATYERDDKEIRTALVRFSNGTRSKRSILHLYPLEI